MKKYYTLIVFFQLILVLKGQSISIEGMDFQLGMSKKTALETINNNKLYYYSNYSVDSAEIVIQENFVRANGNAKGTAIGFLKFKGEKIIEVSKVWGNYKNKSLLKAFDVIYTLLKQSGENYITANLSLQEIFEPDYKRNSITLDINDYRRIWIQIFPDEVILVEILGSFLFN